MSQTAFTGRREDHRLITGTGRYTADVNLPGQLHACFVRADRASALIRSINTSAARASADVVAVFTAADTSGTTFKPPGTMVSYPGRGGAQIVVPPQRPFARRRARLLHQRSAHDPTRTGDAAAP